MNNLAKQSTEEMKVKGEPGFPGLPGLKVFLLN
jgi:hypothetical protein